MNEEDRLEEIDHTQAVIEEIKRNRGYQTVIVVSLLTVFVGLGFLVGWVLRTQFSRRDECVVGATCIGGRCDGNGRCVAAPPDPDAPNAWPPREDYCLNGGAADEATGRAECVCPAGFFGDRCELRDLCANTDACPSPDDTCQLVVSVDPAAQGRAVVARRCVGSGKWDTDLLVRVFVPIGVLAVILFVVWVRGRAHPPATK